MVRRSGPDHRQPGSYLLYCPQSLAVNCPSGSPARRPKLLKTPFSGKSNLAHLHSRSFRVPRQSVGNCGQQNGARWTSFYDREESVQPGAWVDFFRQSTTARNRQCAAGTQQRRPPAHKTSSPGYQICLLPRHRQVQPLLWSDKVVVGVRAQIDLHPVHLPVKYAGLARVV